ncbi:MAG: phosphate-starvation-inducible PsiE family protein [Anaerolineae bacterium]|nr:phosphate-starvation-inducible PsiE family protein [Anaerolineae bacterium]MDW8101265.1 phosphate-starvation-inducible PsiE family protein [Anaerolineae bacterium]
MKKPTLDDAWKLTENLIYIAVGLLLAATAVAVILSAVQHFIKALEEGALFKEVLHILDSLLVVLMLVEILHTVGISVRQHELSCEPFLIIGLIAAIRRILIITAEQSRLILEGNFEMFRAILLELAVLSFMIFIIVGSLYLLRRRGSSSNPEKGGCP